MSVFFLAALLQFANYLAATVNIRAVAHKQYRWAVATDGSIVLMTYFIIQRVAQADSWMVLAGMLVGGTLSSVVGIWLTAKWDNPRR